MLEALRGKKNGALKTNRLFLCGLAAVLAMAAPYLILGTEAVVTYHDQLDGELIAYILQAKHLFDGGRLPEFMCGASKTALTMPAPLFLILFLTGRPFAAYVIMQLAGSVTGYVGMYLLADRAVGRAESRAADRAVVRAEGRAAGRSGKRLMGRGWIPPVVGVLFAYLPFLPVYGLSQYGIPLLLWCFWEVREGRRQKEAFWYAVLYAAGSSLVLSGFGVLGVLGIWIAWDLVRGRKMRRSMIVEVGRGASPDGPGSFKSLRGMICCFLAMTVVYVLENLRLFVQLLGFGQDGVSHKAEYVLGAEPFLRSFAGYFLKGGQHSGDYHGLILAAAAAALLAWGLPKLFGREGLKIPDRIPRLIALLLAWNLGFALIAAVWNSAAGVALRSRLSALGAFQLDRVLWISPALWYLILACVLGAAVSLWNASAEAAEGRTLPRWKGGARLWAPALLGTTFVVLALTGLRVLKESNFKPNLQKCLNPSYDRISYGDYYALGVMDQVEAYIREATGLRQNEYRVASLGIDPAASLYAGFYTVDGYSNNYSLAYKYRFRQVIAPELEKSGYLRDYFDGWGNRCYLLSAECPAYYTVEKGGFFFQELELDARALRAMGCRYVLSAAYIANGEETGLSLVREEPFGTEDSYYNIFLYEVRK